MERNFLEYASYVIVDRAIPELADGLKPVQRRLLATLAAMDDGRFHKVANVIGETMKLHPHGDASISEALVVLANKEYFIERQGNFGNLLTGHPAAAARYIECRLTDLARETLFHKKLTETRPSYDGRRQEPVVLPAKIPVVLMLGTEGIAVGMSTRILPHNFCELLKAQIAILRGNKTSVRPDFLQGGLMDASEYADGLGRVRVRAKLEIARDKKTITLIGPGGSKPLPIPESGDFALPPLENVGVYRLDPIVPQFERLAVNLLDANESNLVPSARAPGNIGQSLSVAAGQARTELWWWLVACGALPLLLIEWWVYTRRVHL